MAVIKKLPARAVIDSFAGIYDFYTHNGQACVRSWPRPPKPTPRMIAAQNNMKDMLAKWKAKSPQEIESWKRFAGTGPWTGRDCFAAMYMRGTQPRPLYNYIGVQPAGLRFRALFRRIQGDVPMLRAMPSPEPRQTSVLEWRGVEFPVCQRRRIDSIEPTYRNCFFVNPNVGGPWVWYFVEIKDIYTHFQMMDPAGIREYCTPMYRYPPPAP